MTLEEFIHSKGEDFIFECAKDIRNWRNNKDGSLRGDHLKALAREIQIKYNLDYIKSLSIAELNVMYEVLNMWLKSKGYFTIVESEEV